MELKIILLACLGGIIPDAIRLLKAKDTGDYSKPAYLKEPMFWIFLLIQIGIGILVVYMFDVKDKVQTVIYAYSGPQILSSLASGLLSKKKPDDPDLSGERAPKPSWPAKAQKFY